jgi:hypothetical protein
MIITDSNAPMNFIQSVRELGVEVVIV